MAAIINTNIMSLNSQRNLTTSQTQLASAMQRLSSGLRINSAKDDAAGMAISDRFTTQIRGLNMAVRNANDAISLAQTAEGALGSISNNLQRIRELSVQSRNATNSASDRQALQSEVQQLKDEIQRVADQTNFNGRKLLDGSFTTQAFQVGANQGDLINVDAVLDANVAQLGSRTTAGFTTAASPVTGIEPTGFLLSADVATPATLTIDLNFAAIDYDPTNTDPLADVNYTMSFQAYEGNANTDPALGSAIEVEVVGVVNASTVAEAFEAKRSDFEAAGYEFDYGAGTLEEAIEAGTFVISRADGALFEVDEGTPTGFDTTIPALTDAATTDGDYVDQDPVFTKLDGTGMSFTINGETIAVAAGAADADAQLAAVLAAINGKTADTGVSAEIVALDGGGNALKLTADADINGDIVFGGAGNDLLKALTGFELDQSAEKVVTAAVTTTGFAGLDISTTGGADDAILAMDAALESVNSARASLGAIQNRFESVVSNLGITAENLTASRSRILDADFAQETANLSRAQILQQAGVAMVAQANQMPQGVLALLR